MKNSRKMRGLLVMLIAFAFCFLAEPVKADDRTALDGIYVEDISVGGMTEEQITQAVNEKIEQLKPSVINLSAGEQNAQVTAGDLGLSCANPEVAREAVTIGQEGNVLKRFLTQNRLKNGETVTFSLKYTVDGEAARQAVENNTAVLNREATDATLTRENGEFIVNPGQTGCSVNVDESTAKVVNYLTTSWRGGIGGVELVTEETPAGAPAWMATFSDLMNLLLCFFVLLFSMSTVDAEKFEMVIASLQSSFSILPSGGASIGDGEMVSSGVSQLQMYDIYYNQMANTQTTDDTSESSDVAEEYKEEALAESEQMAEQVQDLVAQYGIQDQVEIDFNAEYVLLNLNGAVLFDSGKSEIKSEAYPLMDKIGKILQSYQQNMIEIEGHTDNIPFTHSSKYENNDVLSMYRALYVADYMRNITTIDPSHIKSSGRGEYVPIADNSTPEGRARNRRVEIKIYNSYYSEIN